MPTELSTQIRNLVDAAEPVSADEAMLRATTAFPRLSPLTSVEMGPARTWRSPALAAASVVVLAGAGVAWGLNTSGPSNPHHPNAGHPAHPLMILTADQLHTIAANSTAAAESSGTAEVTELQSQGGTAQTDDDVAVTFDGANIDEIISVYAEPKGAAPTFTTDDRLVDGQFYIYTPGPNNVKEWMHDTNSADDASSMQFPDPRTLYAVLSPQAQFELVGTTTVDRNTLTDLKARNPEAINPAALGNLVQGTLNSFTMTIDQNDVVQGMDFASAMTRQVCQFPLPTPLPKEGGVATRHPAKLNFSELKGEEVRVTKSHGLPSDCGASAFSSTVTVAFSNLGAPESVTAPQGAVDFAGKG